MSILTNKSYKQYDKLSRYSVFPYYFNTLDNKYIYGTTAQLYTSTKYTAYTVRKNDTYDSIALSAYNNPTYYWIICDFNRIQDPFTPPEPGTVLKIPSFSSIYFNI